MKKYGSILCCLIVTTFGVQAAIVSFTPTDIIKVSVLTTEPAMNEIQAGTVDPFEARQRSGYSTTDGRSVVTFFKFDISGLTLEEVNDPGFSASLVTDYTFRLNTVNSSGAASVGRITTAWDTSGNNNPLFSYAFDNSSQTLNAEDVQVLIADILNTSPTVSDISVDFTSVVRGWVDGTYDNHGLAIFINGNGSQGAGFDNLTLEVIPEPSTLGLMGIMGGGLLLIRRKLMV
ncbi:MAG: DNRLRE domain-containing protein [Colwellia sp.]